MLLSVENLETAYATSQVLFGVDFHIAEGEAIALLGRNGMGKTTTIRSVMGLVRPKAGTIRIAGRSTAGWSPHRIARTGIGLVPEGRRIFPNLTVRENLRVAARGKGWDIQRVYALFPRLKERDSHGGRALSGGEQQMLAIGRGLMTNPRLLILDEATEGLAPIMRAEIWRCLNGIREAGLSLLVVDRSLEALCSLCDRHYIINKGRIVWTGDSQSLLNDSTARNTHLGL